MADKRQFSTHMLREIHEQPGAVLQTALAFQFADAAANGFEGADFITSILPRINRILIAASGTSRHAGLAGAFMLETLAWLPVRVEYASEFQHSPARLGPEALVMVITQSGETADTRASLHKAKATGASVIAVSNVADSSIMREADARLQTMAGPELAIPSTKAFTAQMAALYTFSVWLAEQMGRSSREQSQQRISELMKIPEKLQKVLEREALVWEVSKKYFQVDDFLFGGRGIHFPIALDGALKLKEVAYAHAEGYPLGEIKHGPLAMIDQSVTAVIVLTGDADDPESMARYEKSVTMAKEIKERGARIIAVANDGDLLPGEIADDVLFVPPAPELLLPIVEIVPLQLLAYQIASCRGNDVDRPRSLVKSVISD
jgi:glutamine---fructose-6-phosphate transaminase (isomerizing)